MMSEQFENIHMVETTPFLPAPSSSSHAPVYFQDITLPAEDAQFAGWEDGFAATHIQGRSP